ncbi:hypothetical protein INT44_001755 [Umbelopsis vinacea]|uniref:Uncharacterized protein n=1 Tax=Umbelopsis vinacea TaxID=44442 RepID=A0A8H7PQT6_9FUNG|nr:hypothetical protein INT44_001755 [Umbelopsis vinacea]
MKIAQSTTDATTPSDQSTPQTDDTSSDSGSTDSTSTDDPTSATPDPGTSSPTPPSTTTTTTQEPTTTTTTTKDAPTATTEEPSPTTTQAPQTTPAAPVPFTTTDVIVHITSVIASQPAPSISSIFMPSSSSMASIVSSSFIASAASTSAILPLPTTGCSANNGTCPTGNFCSNQTCQALLADGTACSDGSMCLSGMCSDSICGPSTSSSAGQNSAGKIAGIVLGSVGGVGCAVGVLFCVRRRNRNHQIQRMRGFTPSMALNGHLNDKNMGNFQRMNNSAERHKSNYSFNSEQAALESLSSMSMSMSPIGRQSAVYYKDNQLHSLSGTMSPFEDTTSYTSSQPVMMASVPLAAYKSGPRSSKFDFLQNALSNRQKPTAVSPLASPSVASSVRHSGLSSVSNWEALISQPRSGFADSERQRGSNRMSSTTFGSGHHHVGIGDDESVADPVFSPAVSYASARVVMPNQAPTSHNPFRTFTPSQVPQDAWTKEDEDGMKNYQYF